ncbi:MAG TPA: hypothetical protein VFM94_09230 [Solirubrobacterales bacterium]|nr:hypothetical protein [Solirubrobacterales bacterium]
MCEVLDFVGQNLLGPILAALIGGPLVAIAFRYFQIPREVGDHDARAVELDEDLRRWVRDRDRQLQRELRTLVNQAGTGAVSRFPVPPGAIPAGAGSQLYSGALVSEAVAGMRAALHEYRDEASGKAREFAALARSETRWHERYRKRHKRASPSLGLREGERATLAEWRERPHPVESGQMISVDDDPTAGEPAIAPLEISTGLTWEAAAQYGDPNHG